MTELARVIVDNVAGDDYLFDYGPRDTGVWYQGGSRGEYSETSIFTSVLGAWGVFRFAGNSIRLAGTVSDGHGMFDYAYAIDSEVSVLAHHLQSNVTRYHQTLAQVDVSHGEHTLVIVLQNADAPLILDYYIYNTTMDRIVQRKEPVTLVVDDSDTTIIYDGSWVSRRNRTSALDQTEHMSRTAGSTATFNFRGTYVAVFGTVFRSSASSSYSINGSAPAVFTSPPTPPAVYSQKFFEQQLEDGNHTLVITLQNDAEFALDYITYKPSLSEPPLEVPLSVPSSSPPSSPFTASFAPEAGHGSVRPNIHAIIGGIVGGLAGFFAIAIIVARLLHRKQRAVKSAPPPY